MSKQTLKKGDWISFVHRQTRIEGSFLYFNFTMTRFRVRLITDVEHWVNVQPYNKQILKDYLNGHRPNQKPGRKY